MAKLFNCKILITFIISLLIANALSSDFDLNTLNENTKQEVDQLRTLTTTGCGDVPADFWAGNAALTQEDINLGGNNTNNE